MSGHKFLEHFLKKTKKQKTAGEPGNKLVITQRSKRTEISKGSWGVGGVRSGRCTHILLQSSVVCPVVVQFVSLVSY